MKEYYVILKKLDTREAVHDYFAEMLELPEYYGRNLDALYDVLTDLSKDVVFALHADAAEEVPDSAKKLVRVLEDAAKENQHIQVKRA